MKTVKFVLFLSACELTVALYRQHFFINEDKSWRDAQRYCRENYDDLSTIDSQEDILWISYEITAIITNITQYDPYTDTQVWIGLNRISTNSGQWSGGDEVNVMSDIPVNELQEGLCPFVQYNMLLYSNCEDMHPLLCYNWEPELILVRENKSWEEALQYCRTHYTDLASLPTNLHLIQVNQNIIFSETPSVWTGLRFLAGSWFWVSGEALENQVQLPECPANYLYCGSRSRETQSWENKDCMEKLNFVCY